jgi:hypothetical protein
MNGMGGIDGHPQLIYEDNGFDQAGRSQHDKFTRKDTLAVIGPFEDNLQATTRAIAEGEDHQHHHLPLQSNGPGFKAKMGL